MNAEVDLRLDATLEEALAIWEAALASGQALRVMTPDGTLIGVNPGQVLYLEPMDPAEAAANGRVAAETPAAA